MHFCLDFASVACDPIVRRRRCLGRALSLTSALISSNILRTRGSRDSGMRTTVVGSP